MSTMPLQTIMLKNAFFSGLSILPLHGKLNPFSFNIHIEHLNHHLLVQLNNLIGVFYIPVGKLAHMHKSVLVNTQIDKHTKIT